MTEERDAHYMGLALVEAQQAFALEEVPIGAIVVIGGEVVASAKNSTEARQDATYHAEIVALRRACKAVGEKYLPAATLYTTLEPCPMCAMSSFWLQVGQVVYGAADPKRGYQLWTPSLLHPKTKVRGGVLEAECAALLQTFFRKLRHSNLTSDGILSPQAPLLTGSNAEIVSPNTVCSQ